MIFLQLKTESKFDKIKLRKTNLALENLFLHIKTIRHVACRPRKNVPRQLSTQFIRISTHSIGRATEIHSFKYQIGIMIGAKEVREPGKLSFFVNSPHNQIILVVELLIKFHWTFRGWSGRENWMTLIFVLNPFVSLSRCVDWLARKVRTFILIHFLRPLIS